MNTLLPDSLHEAIGGISFLLSCGLVLLTLADKFRGHCTRLLAVLLIVSLAAIANHPATYFAAIFIIATAVTELDFLQNLAAIIRGNKEYFQYKKELLTRSEVERRAATELAPDTTPHPGHTPYDKTVPFRRAYALQALAIARLEEAFKTTIERNVRFRRGGVAVEVDGAIQGTGTIPDQLFDVKTFWTKGDFATKAMAYVKEASYMSQQYRSVTGREADINLVAIRMSEHTDLENWLDDIRRRYREEQLPLRVHVLTAPDLEHDRDTADIDWTAPNKAFQATLDSAPER